MVESLTQIQKRYRYIATFGGVPLIWKSQLISEICLSTLHAEFVGLTNALRELIPIQNLIINTLTQLDMPLTNKQKILCCAFKDNQGAYLLATNQQSLVRTKYFCVKDHFFWQFVYHPERNPDGWSMVEKCNTDLMNANYLTKGLVRVKFEGNRFQPKDSDEVPHYHIAYLHIYKDWESNVLQHVKRS